MKNHKLKILEGKAKRLKLLRLSTWAKVRLPTIEDSKVVLPVSWVYPQLNGSLLVQ